jgi:hypothetical protein
VAASVVEVAVVVQPAQAVVVQPAQAALARTLGPEQTPSVTEFE